MIDGGAKYANVGDEEHEIAKNCPSAQKQAN
jgi:hypothetical protein